MVSGLRIRIFGKKEYEGFGAPDTIPFAKAVSND